MVLTAHRHGRAVFDALLRKVLDADARDRLFACASLMGQSIDC
jgi:hypothetical protein